MSARRCCFYCQHSVGLGHLMRSYALCAALAERFRVVLLCGGALPGRHPRRRPASRSSRCRRSASAPDGRLRQPRPALHARAGVGGAARADPRHVPRAAPGRRRRRAVPVRPREVRARARAAARGRARGRRADRLQPARHPRQPPRRPAGARRPRGARSPTRTSTPCSSTATRASRGSRRRSRRAAPLRVPVHYTGFVVREGAAAPAAPRRARASCRPAAGSSASRCCAPPPRRSPAAGVPMRLIARPAAARRRRGERAARARRAGRRAAAHGRRTSAPSCAARAPRSARAATTPRSRSSAPACPALLVPYATPEEDEQLRRARAARAPRRACACSTPERLDALDAGRELRRLLAFEPRAGERRPRRRARAGELLGSAARRAGSAARAGRA